jgi:hypothetical protein
MKIRNGFVSNSSTTSFCIVGTICEALSIEKIKRPLRYYASDYNGIYVGLDIDDMVDNETLLQFKERALKELSQYSEFKDLNIKDISILQDSWDT